MNNNHSLHTVATRNEQPSPPQLQSLATCNEKPLRPQSPATRDERLLTNCDHQPQITPSSSSHIHETALPPPSNNNNNNQTMLPSYKNEATLPSYNKETALSSSSHNNNQTALSSSSHNNNNQTALPPYNNQTLTPSTTSTGSANWMLANAPPKLHLGSSNTAIKVQYEGQIRRFEVERGCQFGELFRRVVEIFPPPCAITTLVYADDEDEFITVTNESDWKHCLSFFGQQQKPVKIIAGTQDTFFAQSTPITPTRTPKSPSAPAHHHHQSGTLLIGNPLQWLKGPVIGTGVHLCINLNNFRFMVVKEINMDNFPVKEIAKEIDILASLHYPHIVRYMAMARQDKIVQIFMEYVSGGSISNLLSGSHGFGGLPEKVVREYTRQLLLAIKHIHDNNIVHCDIKCGNILISEIGTLKLADFGHAMRLGEDGSVSDGAIKGTPLFTAPEVISKEHRYTKAADIWSLGCTIIEMLTNGSPWKSFQPRWHQMAILYHIREAAKNSETPTIPDNLSDEGKRFLTKCFVIDPVMRATADDLLSEPFIMNNDEFNMTSNNEKEENAEEEYTDEDEFSSYHSQENIPQGPLNHTASAIIAHATQPRSVGYEEDEDLFNMREFREVISEDEDEDEGEYEDQDSQGYYKTNASSSLGTYASTKNSNYEEPEDVYYYDEPHRPSGHYIGGQQQQQWQRGLSDQRSLHDIGLRRRKLRLVGDDNARETAQYSRNMSQQQQQQHHRFHSFQDPNLVAHRATKNKKKNQRQIAALPSASVVERQTRAISRLKTPSPLLMAPPPPQAPHGKQQYANGHD